LKNDKDDDSFPLLPQQTQGHAECKAEEEEEGDMRNKSFGTDKNKITISF
jgi:hypothetical protein